MIGGFVRRFVNLYPGEGKAAFLFSCLAFLSILGASGGVTIADGLFVERAGTEGLAWVYFLTALIMFGGAGILLRALNHLDVRRIFLIIVIISAVFFGAVAIAMSMTSAFDHRSAWFALKIANDMLLLLNLTGLWTFIDQNYDLQDAKRLFGLFSAALILGFAAGSALVSLTIDLIGPVGIFIALGATLVSAAVMICCILRYKRPSHSEADAEEYVPAPTQPVSMKDLIHQIVTSRFTLYLLILNVFMWVLMTVMEYSYLETLSGIFASEQAGDHELTRFLGTCRGWVYVGDMIFGAFLYSRLIRRVGVNNAGLIPSAYFFVVFLLWTPLEGVIVAILGVIAVEGIIAAVEDNNFNLLINAVPTRIKTKFRIVIEHFIEPMGMLIGSTLLLTFENYGQILGLILSALAVVSALLLRGKYSKAIYNNLRESAAHVEEEEVAWLLTLPKKEQKTQALRLLDSLDKQDPTTQLVTYECLLQFPEAAVLDRLIAGIPKLEPAVAMGVLELFHDSPLAKNETWISHLRAWREQTERANVEGAINFYLAREHLLHPAEVVSDLESDNLLHRGAAILALLTEASATPSDEVPLGRGIALRLLHKLIESEAEDEVCMGLSILSAEGSPHYFELLLPFLRHDSVEVRRTATRGLARLAHSTARQHAHQLLVEFATAEDAVVRLHCLQVLKKICDSGHVRDLILAAALARAAERRLVEQIIVDMGLRAVPTLLAMTKDARLDDRARVLAGRALGRLSLPKLRAHLFSLIGQEIERAYLYYYHHHTLHKAYPDHNMDELQSSLLKGYRSTIDLVIHLLGVAGSIEDCELLCRSLRSSNEEIHSHAVETLEKSCDPKIFKLLLPLIDDRPRGEKLRNYLQTGRKQLPLSELYERLVGYSSPVGEAISRLLRAHIQQAAGDERSEDPELQKV